MTEREIFQFGEFRLEPVGRVLQRGDAPVNLNRRSFDVLVYLVQNPGRVVTKEELLKSVWADAFVDENNLTQSVSALRKTLDERPGANSYIATVAGRGYQFLPAVLSSRPEPSVASGEISAVLLHERTTSTSIVTEQRLRGWPLNRTASIAGVVLVLAACTGAGYAVWTHMHRSGPAPLVVLSDFENATGDPHLDGVLDGALQIDLKQSPYLSFLSNAKVEDTLAEMKRPKSTALSLDVAREICQRNNAQVLLHGSVAKFGQHYLLTLNAIDCQAGDEFAETKREAAMADDIPHAIDVIAADMRKRLGESRSSIKQFNTPLFDEATNSLEALQRYTEASHVGLSGKYSEAIPLFQRAIELDPHFAMAYADMATCYSNLGDPAHAKAAFKTAYDLRDTVAEQDRLYITEHYDEFVTGDLNETARTLQLWTTIYPKNSVAWSTLANVYTQLGEAALAIPPARKALALNPAYAAAYVILGRALMHNGQLEEAKSIDEQAVAKALDGGDLHSQLMEIAAAQHDLTGIQKQLTWAASSPNVSRLKLNQALLDFAGGQVRLGQKLMSETADGYKQHGMPDVGARFLVSSARILAEEGYPADAQKLVDTIPLLPGMTDPVVALAEVGETQRAQDILNRELSQHPQDTLWNGYKGPQIQAAIFLSEHKPQNAIDALSHATALDYRDFDTLLLRGQAYLQIQNPVAAAQEFRKILDHPGIDPFSYEYPLAQLGLAHSLAAQKKVSESRNAYKAFLSSWKDADPDEPLLKAATAEYAAQH